MPLAPFNLTNLTNNFETRYREANPLSYGALARRLRNNTSFFLTWVNEYAFSNAEDDFNYNELLETAEALRDLGYRINNPPCTRQAFYEIQRTYLMRNIEEGVEQLEARRRSAQQERAATELAELTQAEMGFTFLGNRQPQPGGETVVPISPTPRTPPAGETTTTISITPPTPAAGQTTPPSVGEADEEGLMNRVRGGSTGMLLIAMQDSEGNIVLALVEVINGVLRPEEPSTAPDLRVPARACANAKELQSLGFTGTVPDDICDSIDTQIMDEPVRIIIGQSVDEQQQPKPIYDGGETYVLDRGNVARLRVAPQSRKAIGECEIVLDADKQAEIDAFMVSAKTEKSAKPADVPAAAPVPDSVPDTRPS